MKNTKTNPGPLLIIIAACFWGSLEQCAEFLRSHNYENIEAVNTARAARQVAQDGDTTVAVIDYMNRLVPVQEKVRDKILMVPRIVMDVLNSCRHEKI